MKSIILPLLLMSVVSSKAQLPVLVGDINPGSGSSNPEKLTVFNNKLYFVAQDVVHGEELRSYSGSGSVNLVVDLLPGLSSGLVGNPNDEMAVLNNKLYFSGASGTTGYELMSYDGVNSPTLVADIVPGPTSTNPEQFKMLNGKIYFIAKADVSGYQPFVYDGSNNPQILPTHTGPSPYSPRNFTEYNNKIYFAAFSDTYGYELHVYDPASGSVGLVADINPGAANSNPGKLIVYNGNLYFSAVSAANGRELYYYDGTTATRVTDVAPGADNGVFDDPVLYRNKFYFGGGTYGVYYQMYSYDPASGTTMLAAPINAGGAVVFVSPIVYNDVLYFSASDPTHGAELWKYDGTTASMVADIYPGSNSGFVIEPRICNGVLYFVANDGVHGYELYSLGSTSAVRTVSLNNKNWMVPNPTRGDATLHILLDESSVFNLSVSDALGRRVASVITKLLRGEAQLTVPTSSLIPGTYFYSLADHSGKKVAAGKLIKE